MKTLKALTTEEVNQSTAEVFAAINQKVGMVPNLYAAMGNSQELLTGFLTFEATLKSGEFNNKENETIALAVSQANGCNYCLSAHTMMGKMAGMTDEDTIQIRKGEHADLKTNALATIAREMTENRGKASQDAIDAFFAVGYSKKAFAELIGMVAVRSITNYIFSNGDFEIDFPKAAKLEDLATA